MKFYVVVNHYLTSFKFYNDPCAISVPTGTDSVLLESANYRSSDAGKCQLWILCLLGTRLIPLFFVPDEESLCASVEMCVLIVQ